MRQFSVFRLVLLLAVSLLALEVGCANTPSSPLSDAEPTQVPYSQTVDDLIRNTATFRFDGVPGSIKFTNIVGSAEASSKDVKDWEFTVEYQTVHPGHGDRTGQMLADVVTNHRALVIVKNGVIASAVCDNSHDELGDKPVIDEKQAAKIAEAFVEGSSTFKFDGVEGSLSAIRTEPGWSSAFRSVVVTLEYQTQHPGHGDRTGKMLAQVIANHTAVVLVNVENGTVAMAVCDKTWDMVNDKNPPVSVTGTVVGGGDTTPPGGPRDAPRLFVYEVKRNDGTLVKVAYTAYPPSPVGDAARARITLDFSGGSVTAGDTMEALGRFDTVTNVITVADQGDYIRTYRPKP